MKDREDDKYEGQQEDSEYHFSDDETAYEAEVEGEQLTPTSSTQKASGGASSLRPRRMIIIVVFFVLIFVVYKMLAPKSATQSTDITATSTPVVQESKSKPPQAVATAPTQPAMTAPVTPQAVIPVGQPSSVPTTPPAAVATISPAQAVPSSTPATTPPTPVADVTPAAIPTPAVTPPQASVVVTAPPSNVVVVQAPSQPSPAVASPPSNTVVLPAPTSAPQAKVAVAMPATTTPETPAMVVATPMESRIAAVAAENERMMNQLQSDYSQKFNDAAAQDKQLQTQLEALNARVANIATQMNQLMQYLNNNKQSQRATSSADPKINYTVQAIIPGRAWLRSDSGETVTVAEGDMLKGYGRITKIDPYDGIVEINIGNKAVSLSYGNGG